MCAEKKPECIKGTDNKWGLGCDINEKRSKDK